MPLNVTVYCVGGVDSTKLTSAIHAQSEPLEVEESFEYFQTTVWSPAPSSYSYFVQSTVPEFL